MNKDLEYFYDFLSKNSYIDEKSDIFRIFHKFSQEAIKITMKLNNRYNSPKKIRKLFSKLIGKKIDENFRLFPPFYTDCGKNIHIGKNVFINSGCKFQDQGGIYIGDGTLIGHNATIVTLNHEENPSKRQNLIAKPVKIGKKVWIGSNAVILPGVSIGDGVIIGAGSIVTKNIEKNKVAIGVPAKIIRDIKI